MKEMVGDARPFLTAKWLNLLILNYPCPTELLAPYLPGGVELDTWESQTLISVVGFEFADTKIRGISIPGHINFDEVNLRFYVRRIMPDGEVRRGVVFIRELVAKRLVASVARTIYEEPYELVPLSHQTNLSLETGGSVAYSWGNHPNVVQIVGHVSGTAQQLEIGSQEEFITEHYWGYTKRRNDTTSEYQVLHPQWDIWKCDSASLSGETTPFYGPEFARILRKEPSSALVAVGSEVSVFSGKTI
ncbi:MAG: DUF2071 domain-containing protein [Fimbriimonadaceae bacterium]|nr:MAG: DUF2071 domain-containing protein [Fimbriimonadaceae bacterium]